jgi:hypothetical protein
MMGYIKNSPRTKMSRFFVRQTFPPKTKCLVLDLSVLHVDRWSFSYGHSVHAQKKHVLCGQVDKRETLPKKKLRTATHMDEKSEKG